MTPASLLRAVRKRDAARAAQYRRKQLLRRLCTKSGCPWSDTPDTGYSCQQCFSFILVEGSDACAVKECYAGRLARDQYCAWHMRTMFLAGRPQCYRCDVPCETGRFCTPCGALCQYMDPSAPDGACRNERVTGTRFCRAHNSR